MSTVATLLAGALALEGSAHAQHLFDTDQGERLMEEILRFLGAP